MGDRATCPVCGSHTSSVLVAQRNGEPCPYCDASPDLAAKVDSIRERIGKDEAEYMVGNLAKRLAELETRNRALEEAMVAIHMAVADILPWTQDRSR